jgi:hypothetical protein
MSRVMKKVIKKTPETMSDFQALLDSNKDKLSEGDYLSLCNGMKSMFEKEEKEERNKFVYAQVRIMTPIVENRANSQPFIRMDFRREIIHIREAELDEMIVELKKNNIVLHRAKTHDSRVVLSGGECDECDGNEISRIITSDVYITHVYPQEEWINLSSLSSRRQLERDWGLANIHSQDIQD